MKNVSSPVNLGGFMSFIGKIFSLAIFLNAVLYAEIIDTFYGPIEVEEAVLLDLIKSPAVQRLKSIHQYGISYYTVYREEFNRFDHTMGVFALLRLHQASLAEQISAVLHDVSHTVFSHVGDWVFGREYQEIDYQTSIHKIYLAVSGVEEILNKHGYSVEQVLLKGKEFVMLEQPLPNPCADRIDYNIQGAYYQHFLTKQETLELFNDFYFANGKWIATRKDLLLKLARFSLFMTENCWGGAENYATSRWLADSMLRAVKINLISWKELHFGIDQDVWDKLQSAQDLLIRKRMQMIQQPKDYYRLVNPSEATTFVKFRFRGIDPWIAHKGEVVRLTSVDKELAQEFQSLKEQAMQGWPMILEERDQREEKGT